MSRGPTERRAISVLLVFLSLVLVGLGAIAIASAFVAFRASEAQRLIAADLEQAERAIDEATVAAASNEALQDYKMRSTREALLDPMLAYYQSYVDAHKNDPVPTPELAAAHYRMAGLYAKLGSMKSVDAMNAGTVCIHSMLQAKVDPETLPSLQRCAMDVAAPNEWLLLKGATFADLPKHAARLFVGLQSAKNRFEDAHRAAPDAVRPRDELANLRKYTAMFLERQNRRPQALIEWSLASELLESLVRDKPDNTDYQTRLAESLVAAGKLQKRNQDYEAAVKSLKRAVEVREKLSAAAPDDEALAKDLEAAKKELADVEAAAPAAQVAATPPSGEDASDDEASDEAAPDAPDDAASAESATTGSDDKPADAADKEAGGDDADAKKTATEEPKEDEAPNPPANDDPPPEEAEPEASPDESGSEAPSQDGAPSDNEPSDKGDAR